MTKLSSRLFCLLALAMEVLRLRLPAAFAAHIVTREIAQAEFAEAESLARSKYATREWNERV